MAFGRVPEALDAGNAPLNVTVLLLTPRWWLVNTTRQGWQLRSGTVSEPGMKTLRKLFTDVALNAGPAIAPGFSIPGGATFRKADLGVDDPDRGQVENNDLPAAEWVIHDQTVVARLDQPLRELCRLRC